MNVRTLTGTFALFLISLVCSSATPARAEEAAVPAVEAAEAPKPEALPIAGYDNGFFLQSPDGKFKMTMGGYIQGLFTNDFVEAGPDTTTIRVRRARLKWFGHLFTKKAGYEVEYDFAANKLLSTYLRLTACDEFSYRIGQYHVPFNFEGMTSSSNLEFIDRSILQAAFGIADEREPGMGFAGSLMGGKVEYDLGMFNGEGINTLNQNNEYRYAGRLVWNVAGKHGYDFADVKHSESPNVALGFAGMYNDTPYTPPAATTPAGEKKVTSLTADAGMKYLGWELHGAYLYQRTKPDAVAAASDQGVLLQAGYFVIPEHFETALRYARIFVDGGGDTSEYTAGLNYYIFGGHRMKLQANYSALVTEDGVAAGDDRLIQRVGVQLQFKL